MPVEILNTQWSKYKILLVLIKLMILRCNGEAKPTTSHLVDILDSTLIAEVLKILVARHWFPVMDDWPV